MGSSPQTDLVNDHLLQGLRAKLAIKQVEGLYTRKNLVRMWDSSHMELISDITLSVFEIKVLFCAPAGCKDHLFVCHSLYEPIQKLGKACTHRVHRFQNPCTQQPKCAHKVSVAKFKHPRVLGDQKISEDNQELRPGCPPDYQIFCERIDPKIFIPTNLSSYLSLMRMSMRTST